MAKKANNKTDKKELKTIELKDGFERVTMSNGVDFWSPKEEGETVEGFFVEVLEFPNKGLYAKNKPFQNKPVLKREDGSQVAIPDNFKIHQAIEQFGNVYYRITYKGQTKGTGEHKGKKFNNFEIDVNRKMKNK